MLPMIEMTQCPNLAVPVQVMRHVVEVESAFNPYAIGVVGGSLVRQPNSLAEAVATAEDLERRGFNFSIGLAQVNRYNLAKYGLASYSQAFAVCPNLTAGTRILSECHARAGGDWGKAFSCYYSGNFITGYKHGYVDKVFASMRAGASGLDSIESPIALIQPSAGRPAGGARRKGPLQIEAAPPIEEQPVNDPAFVGSLRSVVSGSAPFTQSRSTPAESEKVFGKSEGGGVGSLTETGDSHGLLANQSLGPAASIHAQAPDRAQKSDSHKEVPSPSHPPPAMDGAFVF